MPHFQLHRQESWSGWTEHRGPICPSRLIRRLAYRDDKRSNWLGHPRGPRQYATPDETGWLVAGTCSDAKYRRAPLVRARVDTGVARPRAPLGHFSIADGHCRDGHGSDESPKDCVTAVRVSSKAWTGYDQDHWDEKSCVRIFFHMKEYFRKVFTWAVVCRGKRNKLKAGTHNSSKQTLGLLLLLLVVAACSQRGPNHPVACKNCKHQS
eukprot:scaffold2230_cov187-Amphora_coffeaeformis.AAC.12